ncbi:MAG: lysine--tRNA ligase [Lentisphaerae bacterium]|nr:MAG: lysine--tRNA ligase [Lentisphaerota bacterium]
MTLSDQELARREALERLRELGIDPYPAEEFPVTHESRQILDNFSEAEAEQWQNVRVAGRVMLKRIMGKASFVELQDPAGRIQLYIKRDDLCPGEDKTLYNQVFKKYVDIGDFIGVEGFVFKTRTGETTIHVKSMTFLSKALRPLPIRREKDGKVYDGFRNPEQRYRMRYVDLAVNPEVADIFIRRSEIIQSIRQKMVEAGCLEVETPVLQPIYGGANARPFTTHHNALNRTLYLRISNELYLKRLIVGGFRGVFEFSRNFRNEGMDRNHNPEFTCVEMYVAFRDYQWMMNFTERAIAETVKRIHGTTVIPYGDKTVDFSTPWKRIRLYDAVKEATGFDISEASEDKIRLICDQLGIEVEPEAGKGRLIDKLFSETCESKIVNPTFIIDYPVEMSPLAKRHRDNPALTERFEVICCGMEICNAFSELNDPIDQKQRFEAQLKLRQRGDDEAMVLDEDYIRALEYGMPCTAGLGIGIDRLVMLLTNQHSIQEVLLFPQMRPEKEASSEEKKEDS